MTESSETSAVPQVGSDARLFSPARRWLWIVVAGAVVVMVGIGTSILVSRMRTDVGVAACRHAAKPASAFSTNPSIAKLANHTARTQFAGSRYADLRIAGGHYVDAMDQLMAGYGAPMKPGVEPVPQAWAELTEACGHHRVTLPSLTP